MSQNRYISPTRGGAPICTKFGELVDLTDVIKPVLVPKYSLVFPGREVEKAFSLKKANGLNNSAMRYRAGL